MSRERESSRLLLLIERNFHRKSVGLEEELAKVKDEPSKEILLHESERREVEEDKESKEDLEKCVISKCQEIEGFKQIISEKEKWELEHISDFKKRQQ